MDEEYLDGLTQLLREDHPDKKMTKQDVQAVAHYLTDSLQLVYKPIPKSKKADYLEILQTVTDVQKKSRAE